MTDKKDETINLKQRFAVVKDLSDPTLIDHLDILREQIVAQDKKFIKILLKKKNEMVVSWPQPWYQKSKSLTRPLKSIGNRTDSFRTGAINSEEKKMIAENWKKFRKLYGVPNTPLCLARWKNKSKSRHPDTPEEIVRRFVISFLASGLKRTLYQVHKYFVTEYGSPNKGPFSTYEQNVMAVCQYHSRSNSVPFLSLVLGREPRGIYKKLRQMQNGKPDRKKLKWTLPVASKFLRLLMQYTGKPLKRLKNKKIDKSVWVQLENDMDQQYIYLKKYWHHTLHVQLFANEDVKDNKIRKKVLNILQQYPYKIWPDIRWREVASHFSDGYSHGFLYILTRQIFIGYTGYTHTPLEKLISYGIKKIKTMSNKRLRNLILNENQELVIKSYEKQ